MINRSSKEYYHREGGHTVPDERKNGNRFKLKDWAFLLIPLIALVSGYSVMNYQVKAQAKEADAMETVVVSNTKDIIDLRLAVQEIKGDVKGLNAGQNSIIEMVKEIKQAVRA